MSVFLCECDEECIRACIPSRLYIRARVWPASDCGVYTVHPFMREVCKCASLAGESACCIPYKVTYPYTFTVDWLTPALNLHISWWCCGPVGGGRVAATIQSCEPHVREGKFNTCTIWPRFWSAAVAVWSSSHLICIWHKQTWQYLYAVLLELDTSGCHCYK